MPLFTKPCKAMEDHIPRQYRPNELESNWRFHHTPPAKPKAPARVAIVFDCEMGVTEEGESELIRVSVVDYFTSAVLLDSLVWPDIKMKDLNTPFSGVSWKALNDARRNKSCLFGRANARNAVWSLLSPDTVVIGHGANNDLNILRWIHPNIVDTLLVEQKLRDQEKESKEQDTKEDDQQNADTKPSGGGGGGSMSLKKLARERLDRGYPGQGQGA
ncbi:RNA exonuclease 3 [Apiospora rasikravindrae]|uniref:RNA exonuclease 3 n=1 Tax=Apiospora rasikravindrae TaxID=990691 RepID=A0ABR1RSD0_9PEZI